MFQSPTTRDISAWRTFVRFFPLFNFFPLKKGSQWKILIDGNFFTCPSLFTEPTRNCSSQHLYYAFPFEVGAEAQNSLTGLPNVTQVICGNCT